MAICVKIAHRKVFIGFGLQQNETIGTNAEATVAEALYLWGR
jgi:hypothetical protein